MADSDMSIIKSRKASVTRTTRETDISVEGYKPKLTRE